MLDSPSLRDISPLLLNPHTSEPYLPLPPPFSHIILTPPRLSDVSSIVEILNDPKVYTTLIGPPYPYLESDATAWLEGVMRESDAVLHDLRDGSSKLFVGGCPVRILREVQEGGTDIFLGDIGVDRCGFPDCEDQVDLVNANERRVAGDEEIVWCIGGAHMPSWSIWILIALFQIT